jgi:Zn-dependent protease with chaperone function
MHLILILISLIIAYLIRLSIPYYSEWQGNWHYTLFLFIFSPLLLLMTILAVLFMGNEGEMLGNAVSYWGFLIAIVVLLIIVAFFGYLAYQGWQTKQHLNKYSRQKILDTEARIIPISFPYIAQVGFWQPELVVTEGLLCLFDREHLEAVFAHEASHVYYRDTFSFFWLGGIYRLTFWLPYSEVLWQELLFLRELRADHYASQLVDPLLLAEALFMIVKFPLESTEILLSCGLSNSRLGDRIDHLLHNSQVDLHDNSWMIWFGFFSLLLPWLTIPYHVN